MVKFKNPFTSFSHNMNSSNSNIPHPSEDQDLGNTLIPRQEVPPLTKTEISLLVAEDATVHASRQTVQHLSQTVYGNKNALNKDLVRVISGQKSGEMLAEQVTCAPESVSSFAGHDFLGFKDKARKEAEGTYKKLGCAIEQFADTVRTAKKCINEEHQQEQQRRNQQIEKPSETLQHAFSLSKDQQREALTNSPELRKEVSDFLRQVSSRLTPEERKSVNQGNHRELAKSVGVSEEQAKTITDIVQNAKELNQQAQQIKPERQKTLALAG
ncbi:BID domain-containing T4SS effector [Bartonella sp. cb54]|uniref:BID domain-containing T4SS effector n=1 Tax=Bartonella sp. cb54 TaxID=3385560 RepID=UPI0039A422D9